MKKKALLAFLTALTIAFTGCMSMSEKLENMKAELSGSEITTTVMDEEDNFSDDSEINNDTEVTSVDNRNDEATDEDDKNSEPSQTTSTEADKKNDDKQNDTEASDGDNDDDWMPTPPEKVSGSGKRCVGYYTSWSAYARNVTVNDIDASNVTHLNFAFANVNGNGEVVIGDSWVDLEKPFCGESWEASNDSRGHFSALRKLKAKYPHLKTLISIGGWTWSSNFSKAAATDASRKRFAETAMKFITKYGFDGIDVDWEYPVEGGNNIPHSPNDKENYVLLLKECRKALDAQGAKDGKHYLLTIATPARPAYVDNMDIKGMMKYLDFINIMAYDYHGGFDAVTGHNAPMKTNDKDDTFCITKTVEAHLKSGVDPKNFNLGLPFYGRGWTNVAENKMGAAGQCPKGTGMGQGSWEGGVWDYSDLEQNYINKNGYKRYWDKTAMGPYLYNGTTFISYDDPESFKIKLDYAESKGLGGVMFWEFSGDKNKTLQNTITSYYGGKFGKASSGGNSSNTNNNTNNNSDNNTPSDTPADTSGSAWDSSASYGGGDIVSYNGHSYKARWWTQGETPADSEWGAWEKIS